MFIFYFYWFCNYDMFTKFNLMFSCIQKVNHNIVYSVSKVSA